MNRENNRILLMDFSGVYDAMDFWRNADAAWISCRDLPGTNCYCDGDAMRTIRERMEALQDRKIHFVDSGNYHYLSRLWTDRIEQAFDLMVFDNHTDMQPPAFGGLLSCGGWIASALEENPFLHRVILVGPDEEAFSAVPEDLKGRVSLVSREALCAYRNAHGSLSGIFSSLPEISDPQGSLPLYLSIDKDILREEELRTGWSQGDVSLAELLGMLDGLSRRIHENGRKCLGIDICGECGPDDAPWVEKSDGINRRLMEKLVMLLEGAADEK